MNLDLEGLKKALMDKRILSIIFLVAVVAGILLVTGESEETGLKKTETPEVELFVMSYCPYGTQMQRAITPVENLLGDKADIEVKFVDYAMHGGPEIMENTKQYCIQKNSPDKYWNYLDCFLENGNSSKCSSKIDTDTKIIEECVNSTLENQVMDKLKNKSKWSSSYPPYPVNGELNKQYNVSGSPTLVINGQKVNVDSRSPEAIKNKICSAFKTKPPECEEKLSSQSTSAGFGSTESSGSSGTCG